MESLNPEFALYDKKNECTKIDTVFFPSSKISEGRFPFRIHSLQYTVLSAQCTLTYVKNKTVTAFIKYQEMLASSCPSLVQFTKEGCLLCAIIQQKKHYWMTI